MKNILITAILGLFILVTTVQADEAGFYMGVGSGSTGFEDDDLGRDIETLSAIFNGGTGTTNFGSLRDDTDSGYILYGGYKFNHIIGIEASYRDYGKFTYRKGATYEATSFSIAANAGYAFFDGQLRPFGLAGLAYVSDEYSNTGNIRTDEDTGAFHLGVGVEYEPKALKGLGFRLAYEADIYIVESEISNDYEDDYALSLGMVYLGVQYKF